MRIWFIFCMSFVMASVLSMTRPATSLYGSELGMSAFEIGVLVSLFSLAPMLIAIRAGIAADRFGDRIVIVLGFVAMGLGLLLPYLFRTEASLYAAQALVGMGQVMSATSLQNLVGNVSTVEDRDRNFAWLSTFVAAGFSFGPFVGGIIAEQLTFLAVFATGAAVFMAASLAGLLLPRRAARQSAEKPSVVASFRLLRLPAIQRALLSGAIILYSRDIFQAYFPLYGEYVGLSPFAIGLVISLQGGSMFVARLLLPVALRRWSRETILLWAIFLSGLGFIVIPVNILTVTYLAAIAMGLGLGCGQPITMAQIYNASPEGRSGEVLGLRMTTLRLTQSIAPLFFGAVGTVFGILGVFFANGAFLFAGGYAVRRQRPPA